MEKRGVQYDKKVIAFQMLKGGSTKTSDAFNLAIRLNQYGARVLCLDLDMQGNLTDAFNVEAEGRGLFYHVLNKEATFEEIIVPLSEGLDLVPSDFDNSGIDFLINMKQLNVQRLVSQHLEQVKHLYDFIIIDCNPSLSSLNVGAALSSDQVIIPVNPDKFSRKGLRRTIAELNRLQEEYKKKIDYKLLFTLFDAREASSSKYLIEYGSEYKDRLFSTVIRRNTDVKSSIDRKQNIFDIKNAPAREDFDLFAREILGIRELAKQASN